MISIIRTTGVTQKTESCRKLFKKIHILSVQYLSCVITFIAQNTEMFQTQGFMRHKYDLQRPVD